MDLSTRRRRILDRIVPTVVPSVSGTATFSKIDARWVPNAGYTTCGGLPAYVAGMLGLTAEGAATRINTGGGLAGRVTKVDDGYVTVEIAQGVEVIVQKPAVAIVLPKGTLKSL